MPIVANQLGKKVVIKAAANDVVQLAQTAVTYGSAYTFNANTSVNATADAIALTLNLNAPPRVNDPMLYLCAAGNTANIGFTNNTLYYVTFANQTHLAFSTTKGGANVNLTLGATESGHTLTLAEDVLGLTISKVISSIPDSGTANFVNVARATTTMLNLAGTASIDLAGQGIVIDTANATSNVNITFHGNQNAFCIVECRKQSLSRWETAV